MAVFFLRMYEAGCQSVVHTNDKHYTCVSKLLMEETRHLAVPLTLKTLILTK
jgi:hypothetical protein